MKRERKQYTKMREMKISKDDNKTGEKTKTEKRTQKINEWHFLVHSIPLK